MKVLNNDRVSCDDIEKLGEELDQCFINHTNKMNKRHGINGGVTAKSNFMDIHQA